MIENLPSRAIILDTETTGLGKAHPVEIGFLHFPIFEAISGNNFLSELQYTRKYRELFRPRVPIQAGAQKVHGIKLSDVIGKPYYTADRIEEEIPDSVEYLVGHNISFDYQILQCEGSGFENAITIPRLKRICTLKLARKLWPELKSKALTKIVNEYCPDVAANFSKVAHGALADCFLTATLLWVMSEEFEIKTWEEFYELQES